MADQRPNILLFTTDQHRGDHLGIAGHSVVERFPRAMPWAMVHAPFQGAGRPDEWSW